MASSRVAVVVPVRRWPCALQEAVSSALAQTHPPIEVLVVHAESERDVPTAVQGISDLRVRSVSVPTPAELDSLAAQGIAASSAPLVLFLEPEDRFCTDKVQAHVDVFEARRDLDVAFNGHFEMDAAGTPLRFWKPRRGGDFAGILLDWHLGLSDVAVRRHWALGANPFRAGGISHGGGLNVESRLGLGLGRWAAVGRILNQSQRRSTPTCGDLDRRLSESVGAIESSVAGPACPSGVSALREPVLGQAYMDFSYQALCQSATTTGQECFRTAIRLDRSWIETHARRYRDFLIEVSTGDGGNPEPILRHVFEQLPRECAWLIPYCDLTIGEAHLARGLWAAILGRDDQGLLESTKAVGFGATVDRRLSLQILDILSESEAEFGAERADRLLKDLARSMRPAAARGAVRWVESRHYANRAFTCFRRASYHRVPGNVARAILSEPRLLMDRGLMSILLRSSARMLGRGSSA